MREESPRGKRWPANSTPPAIARIADEEITLAQAIDVAYALMEGKVKGRVIVNPNA